jgi:3-hydroxyisobutyrate dehydrogenase-like beta-hydroxyacid dehydrogenase
MAPKKEATIIGLGSMGIKLAQLLVDAQYRVTVWNRTLTKANALSGVFVAEDMDTAFAASPVIVMCIYDYQAVKSILYGITDRQLLAGKTIINFTTGNPQEPDEIEAWLHTHQAGYLNGALQVAPDQMGLADTTILLSGNPSVYSEQQATLRVFGGNLKYLGNKASLASAMDLATLSWLYGSYIGLLHGVGLCQKSGLDLHHYRDILGEITPGFTEFFKHQIGVIQNNDFTISQSPLSISVSATKRIHEAAREYGLHTDFLSSISGLLQAADTKGMADKEVASLIELVNPGSVTQPMQPA